MEPFVKDYQRWLLLVLIAGSTMAYLMRFFHGSSGDSLQQTLLSTDTVAEVRPTLAPSPLHSDAERLVLLTYASADNFALRRYVCSLEAAGLSAQVMALGDVHLGVGEKVLRLRRELLGLKDDAATVVLFSDAYDVLFLAGADAILARFKKLAKRVVFSADTNCWPYGPHCHRYPASGTPKTYLNSGLLIGYAPDLYRVVSHWPLSSQDDDQEYYARIFTDAELRRRFDMAIDYRSELFQTVDGGSLGLRIDYRDSRPVLRNVHFETEPVVVHTPGYCKELSYRLANYVPAMWSSNGSCSLASLEDEDYRAKVQPNPQQEYVRTILNGTTGLFVGVGLLDDAQEPLEDFLAALHRLNYPKQSMHLFIEDHTTNETHISLLEEFAAKHHAEYKSFVLNAKDGDTRSDLVKRNADLLYECAGSSCSHRLKFGRRARIVDRQWIQRLMANDQSALAPMFFGAGGNFFTYRTRNRNCPNYVEINGGHQFRITLGFF